MTNCLSPSSIQGGWPRADIHPQVLPTPVPTLSNPCSSVTPEAAKRTWQAERGRERERGVEATSHLGSHFEPLPLLPPEHHMFGCGQTNPGPGSCRSQEERRPCLKTGMQGHPLSCHDSGWGRCSGEVDHKGIGRCWAGMGLGADRDCKTRDRDVLGGCVQAGCCLQMGARGAME